MNNSTTAQKGFKTFLLTLSVSLLVFGFIYYLISNSSQSSTNISQDVESKIAPSSAPAADASDKDEDEGMVAGSKTAFSDLAYSQSAGTPVVLAGATESTQGTTPASGVVSITFGLILSALVFAIGLYIIATDPRRLALIDFEKKITKGL